MNGSSTLLAAACFAMVGCEFGGPYESSGFDPLDAAGGVGTDLPVQSSGRQPGEFVNASGSGTAFFKSKPAGDANADRLLVAGTPMKVISDDGSYVKVELDSGEIGYVPSVMVMGENDADSYATGDEYQIYPPVDEVVPLEADPNEDSDIPVLPPTIDPDAPADLPALPDDAPTPGLGAEPPLEAPEVDAEPASE